MGDKDGWGGVVVGEVGDGWKENLGDRGGGKRNVGGLLEGRKWFTRRWRRGGLKACRRN